MVDFQTLDFKSNERLRGFGRLFDIDCTNGNALALAETPQPGPIYPGDT